MVLKLPSLDADASEYPMLYHRLNEYVRSKTLGKQMVHEIGTMKSLF